VRSLHYVHEIIAYRANHVCLSLRLSVRMIQLENRWTDLDDIWYGSYAIGIYPKIVLFNFLQSAIPIWRTSELVSAIDTIATYTFEIHKYNISVSLDYMFRRRDCAIIRTICFHTNINRKADGSDYCAIAPNM
jgi:hypothetical protein